MANGKNNTRGRGSMARDAGTREAFLRDIIEHPDDDAPRLRFADWLQDHGDPARAEFIRVQCELARVPGPYGGTPGSRREQLRDRENELLGRHGDRWVAE